MIQLESQGNEWPWDRMWLIALPPIHAVTLGMLFWMRLLTITVSIPSPHLISPIQKMKNNHWLTLTKIFQPANSTFVKLNQMICKEPSRTLIWWLDILFPQSVSSLGQDLLREAIQYSGKRIGFDVECICIWISAPPPTGCFALNEALDRGNN